MEQCWDYRNKVQYKVFMCDSFFSILISLPVLVGFVYTGV